MKKLLFCLLLSFCLYSEGQVRTRKTNYQSYLNPRVCTKAGNTVKDKACAVSQLYFEQIWNLTFGHTLQAKPTCTGYVLNVNEVNNGVCTVGGGGTGSVTTLGSDSTTVFTLPNSGTVTTLTATVANTNYYYDVTGLTGTGVAGKIVKSTVSGLDRITFPVAGHVTVSWDDYVRITSSTAGSSGNTGELILKISQNNAGGVLRTWVIEHPIEDPITHPISFPFTISSNLVPVSANDFFTFRAIFRSSKAGDNIRISFPAGTTDFKERIDFTYFESVAASRGPAGPAGPAGPTGPAGPQGPSSPTVFTALQDTPNSYTGHGGELCIVSDGEDEIEFGELGFTALNDTPQSIVARGYVRGNTAGTALEFVTTPPGSGGGSDSASDIRDKLQTLSGESRLDASAIKNLPSGGGSADTAAQIKTKLETLTDDARLSASAIKDIPPNTDKRLISDDTDPDLSTLVHGQVLRVNDPSPGTWKEVKGADSGELHSFQMTSGVDANNPQQSSWIVGTDLNYGYSSFGDIFGSLRTADGGKNLSPAETPVMRVEFERSVVTASGGQFTFTTTLTFLVRKTDLPSPNATIFVRFYSGVPASNNEVTTVELARGTDNPAHTYHTYTNQRITDLEITLEDINSIEYFNIFTSSPPTGDQNSNPLNLHDSKALAIIDPQGLTQTQVDARIASWARATKVGRIDITTSDLCKGSGASQVTATTDGVLTKSNYDAITSKPTGTIFCVEVE